jgi:hypothetical protein
MPEPEIITQPRMKFDGLSDNPSILDVIYRCCEGASLILETPHRRQAWRVIDGIWKCVGDIRKEVF